MQSENIAELAAALSKAQANITGALKDSANPFFKSKYADLAACWDACRKQLTDNGLSVIQTTDIVSDTVVVRTTLAHASGQWISGILPVKAKDDGPQAQGSGITYARRYALAAIVGLAQIDDDAEAAQGRPGITPKGDVELAIPTAQSRPGITPKGDMGLTIPASQRDPLVAEIRAAFDLDAEETQIAQAVLAIYSRIRTQPDLCVAVADAMTAKERNALKAYIKMAQEAK